MLRNASPCAQMSQCLDHRIGTEAIQPCCGFIAEQENGICDQFLGQTKALSLSPRQLLDACVRRIPQADGKQQIRNPLTLLRFGCAAMHLEVRLGTRKLIGMQE